MKNLLFHKLLGVSTLMLFAHLSTAQQVITLEECKRKAMESNEAVKNALLDGDIANAKIDETFTNRLPSVESSVTGAYFTDNPIISLAPTYSTIFVTSINQPIYTGGRIKNSQLLARKEKELASLGKDLTEQNILFNVEQVYLGAISLREQIVVANDYVASLTQLERKISDFYQVKMVNKTELLEVQVAKNRAIYRAKVVEDAFLISKERLSNLVGGIEGAWKLDETVRLSASPIDISEGQRIAIEERPEILILNEQLDVNTLELDLSNAAYRPQVSVSLGLQYFVGEDVFGTPPGPGGEPAIPINAESEQVFGSALLNVSIPIFQWGQKKHKARQINLQAEKLRNQRVKLSNDIDVEVQSAIQRMDEADLNLDLTLKSKEQAEENLRITRDNYNAGLITSEEVLEAEALNQQASVDYINAQVERRLSTVNYFKSIGQLKIN